MLTPARKNTVRVCQAYVKGRWVVEHVDKNMFTSYVVHRFGVLFENWEAARAAAYAFYLTYLQKRVP